MRPSFMPNLSFSDDRELNRKRLRELAKVEDTSFFKINLRRLPDASDLKRLVKETKKFTELYVEIDCPEADHETAFPVEQIQEFTNARYLNLSSGWKRSDLTGIKDILSQLYELEISQNYDKTANLEGIENCQELKILCLRGVSEGLERVAHLQPLKNLYIEGVRKAIPTFSLVCDTLWFACCSVSVIEVLSYGSRINTLQIAECRSLSSLNVIGAPKGLKSLVLNNLPKIKTIESFQSKNDLINLHISDLKHFYIEESFLGLSNLSYLKIVGDSAVHTGQFTILSQLPKLKYGLIIIEENGKLIQEAYPLTRLNSQDEKKLFFPKEILQE